MSSLTTSETYLQLCRRLSITPLQEVLEYLNDTSRKSCKITSPLLALEGGHFNVLEATLAVSPIKELCFSLQKLPNRIWHWLAELSCKSKSLCKLVIEQSSVTDGPLQPSFFNVLSISNLIHLDFIGCSLGSSLTKDIASSQLLKRDTFVHLGLSYSNISCEDVISLSGALQTLGMMCGLQELNLSNNKIGDRGACELACMLTTIPLQRLNLSSNQITDAGGTALARATKEALVLAELNVGSNPLSDATIIAFADALKEGSGSSLTHVSLAKARASEKAVSILINSACKNPNFRELDMKGVPLGLESAAIVVSALNESKGLSRLAVDTCSPEVARFMIAHLKPRGAFKSLDLGGPMSSETAEGSRLNGSQYMSSLKADEVDESSAVIQRDIGYPSTSIFSSQLTSHSIILNDDLSSQGSQPGRAQSAAAGSSQRFMAAASTAPLSRGATGVRSAAAIRPLGGKLPSGAVSSMGEVESQRTVEQGGASVAMEPAGNPLLRVFQSYCGMRSGGERSTLDKGMSCSQFTRLARDAMLLNPQGPLPLSMPAVIHSRCRPFGSARLDITAFSAALDSLASHVGLSRKQLEDRLGCNLPPTPTLDSPRSTPPKGYPKIQPQSAAIGNLNPLFDTVSPNASPNSLTNKPTRSPVRSQPSPSSPAHRPLEVSRELVEQLVEQRLQQRKEQAAMQERLEKLENELSQALLHRGELSRLVGQVDSLAKLLQRLTQDVTEIRAERSKARPQESEDNQEVQAAAEGREGVIGIQDLHSLEKRLLDKQSRLEGAILQVALKVDELDVQLQGRAEGPKMSAYK